MTHHIIFFDVESYYDSEYSLRKMAPPNYILDPRFETIGCAFKVDGGPSVYVDGPDIPAFLAQYDPAKTTTVAFNALFDNCILAWRYGFVPARMVCTMRLAVALRGHELRGASLAKVGEALHIGVKGTTIADAKGKHRADIMSDPEFYRAYQAYANNDNEMNASIFHTLYPELPVCERRVMDLVLRCAVEPAFVCDTEMLVKHLESLEVSKNALLDEAIGAPPGFGMSDRQRDLFKTSLRSNTQFEALLQARGVDIEYKVSPTTGEAIPAFSKSDDFMAELQDHEDPVVRLLAAARLDLRSTIESTRGERILSMARLPWGYVIPATGRHCGMLPIPLKYAAAHTHRLGGDWKLNFQNLPAGRGGQVSMLRKALCAPEGHKVVVADKSQIECRINAWLCGQHDLVKVFADGGDPYSRLASGIFGYPVNKKDHPVERFIGKTGELGLGFGCGHVKFHNMVVRSARGLGLDMNVLAKIWNPDVARRAVVAYRNTHGAIQETWRALDVALRNHWLSHAGNTRIGPCRISYGCVEGPSGLRMNYSNPREEVDADGKRELCYNYGNQRYTIYGSKLLENIVQFLARINTMHDALRICDRGYRFVMQAHDELVWIVPDDKVEDCKRVVLEEMTRPPSWGRDIPLAAECGVGQSYGDAK